MTDIDILALLGIDIAELDAYEQIDSGGGWAAFRTRKAKVDPPRPARASLGRRVKGCAAKPCRLRPQAGICDPCIDAPGFGRLSNSLSEGFNDKAKTPKKACCGLSNFERLRKRTSPHLRQKRPRGLMEILGKRRPQEKSENPKI